MKIFEGTIISIGTGNTAVVEVYSKTPHPLYKKLIKRSKKYKVDFAGFEPEVGQKVRIAETRPISKDKYFKISEIVEVSKVANNPARSFRSPLGTVRTRLTERSNGARKPAITEAQKSPQKTQRKSVHSVEKSGRSVSAGKTSKRNSSTTRKKGGSRSK